MNNFYIAFAVYLNLIFIAAKLWEQINWSWGWVMAPLTALTIVGLVASLGKTATRKKSKSHIIQNIQSIRDLIESTKSQRAAQKEGKRHWRPFIFIQDTKKAKACRTFSRPIWMCLRKIP